ncbi:MAG: NusG domain II-containing protein [Bacillota bacterium]|nr:NusG domain II-containing protein [Bacillota bacterium]
MFKKADIILVVIIIIVAAIGYAGITIYRTAAANDVKIAEIIQDSKVIRTINLDALKSPLRIQVSGDYHEVILAEKGRIRFEDADCPDRICVKTGWLTKVGESASCVPNRVMIKIKGESQKVDGVTY